MKSLIPLLALASLAPLAGAQAPAAKPSAPSAKSSAPASKPPAKLDPVLLKLKATQLPQIEMPGIKISTALETLGDYSAAFSKDRKGVKFSYAGTASNDPVVELSLKNTNLLEVLDKATTAAGCTYAVKDGAIVVTPAKK